MGPVPGGVKLLWAIVAFALSATTIAHWQSQIEQLRSEWNLEAAAATNHGIMLLVAAASSSLLSSVAFFAESEVPPFTVTLCLWAMATASIVSFLSLQSERELPTAARSMRAGGLSASAVTVLALAAVTMFWWPTDSWLWRAPTAVSILTLAILTMNQIAESRRRQ